MCLSRKGYERYCRLARNLDDEKLLELDAYYRYNTSNTVEQQLHSIVSGEIRTRRLTRQRQLERCYWISSRRGRVLEAIKRWLIRHRLWSSALSRRPQPLDGCLLVGMLRLLVQISSSKNRAAIAPLPGSRSSAKRT